MNYRLIHLAMLLAITTQLTGCFTIRSWFDERHYSRDIKKRAEKVWNHSETAYHSVEHNLKDFERGFIDGYIDVARGGDGCPPTIPPPRYWKTKYSNPQGQKHIIAYFDGYQHGAASAFQHGADGDRQLLTSAEVYRKCKEYVEFHPESLERHEHLEDPDASEWLELAPDPLIHVPPVPMPESSPLIPVPVSMESTPVVPPAVPAAAPASGKTAEQAAEKEQAEEFPLLIPN